MDLAIRGVVFCISISALASPCVADEALPTSEVLKAAVNRAIPLLEAGSKGSADHRQCFTCHSQALPVLALAEIRKRGLSIDEDNFQRQLDHTAAHLERGQQAYLAGNGQGGKVLTAGYALWTLEAGGRPADETTAAVAKFLLSYQKNETHWHHRGNRPPSSGSDIATTYVALRGLAAFGTNEQQTEIAARRVQVGTWLAGETPRDTEDQVFRLWILSYLDSSAEVIDKAVYELLAEQRVDGGWGQTPDMASDAYATATVLVALIDAGKFSPADAASIRGLRYLLDTQQKDGSWHVVSRAKGFQAYFESGFPHGKDQFISISASSWAALALALAISQSP